MAFSLWKARIPWIPVTGPHLAFYPQLCNFDYWKIYQKIIFCSYSEAQQRSDDEVDIKERASKIFSALQSKGLFGYSEKDTTSLYSFLLNLGIKSTAIEAQFLETPDILKFPVNRWNKTCEIMEQNGLSNSEILQHVALCPEILKMKPSTLSNNLLQYSQIKLGRQNFLSFLNRYPLLFLSHPSMIKKRVMFLKSIFPPNVSTPLIKNNPNVLVDKWEDIAEKIMYIHKMMGLEQPHIAHSEALRRSLLHIKTRHQFLFRAGLYITPKLEKDKQSYRRNPSLSDIMDTSDRYFSNRVARLTEYEYKIFSYMMEEEEEPQDSDSEESDDENPDFGYDLS